MSFSKRLIQIRKERDLTQNALAELSGIHISQIRRWETGNSRPILEGVIKLAKTLHVSIDDLVFDPDDRAPKGNLKLMFEAVEQLKPKDKYTIEEILKGMISRYESQRLDV